MTDKALYCWFDLETTGVGEEAIILEVALLVTDGELAQVCEPWTIVVHHPWGELARRLDPWAARQHAASGLLEAVQASPMPSEWAHQALARRLAHLHATHARALHLAGYSVHQDLRWLERHWPGARAMVSHRVFDVSTLRQFVQQLDPALLMPRPVAVAHRALRDVHDALEEARHYRELLRGRLEVLGAAEACVEQMEKVS